MLEKTMSLLKMASSEKTPNSTSSYDPDEIDALGRALQPLVYGPTEIRKRLQKNFGVTITRADFYSEIPTIEEIENSEKAPSLLTLAAIFPDNDFLIAEMEALHQASLEFDPPVASDTPGVYSWQGGPFSFSDAVVYYSMIRTRKPKTIIEIGSGWSTLVARDACKRNGFGKIICIEPYPNKVLMEIDGIEIIEKRAQDVQTDYINNILRDGDILFIDSTHTVKHDSDCLHIYLRILPFINARINVHVHDIYLPGLRPAHLMLNHQVYWNEQYLLYAYLITNDRTKVLYGSWYHWLNNRSALERLMAGKYQAGGNSLWFEQRAPKIK